MTATPGNYYRFIDQTLRHTPHKAFIIWPEQAGAAKAGAAKAITGRMLLDRVSANRQRLHRHGIGPDDAVLFAAPVSLPVITLLLAVMAHGTTPVLPPASATGLTLLRILRRHPVKGLVVARQLPLVFRLLLRLRGIRIIPGHELPVLPADWQAPAEVSPDKAALITHSSGSTGVPKAIRRSHRVLTAQHNALENVFPAWPGQRDFPLFPNILLHNLATGTTSILPDLPGFRLTALEPELIIRQLADREIHTMTGNVFYFRKLLTWLHTHPQVFPAVRAIGIGGSPVPDSLCRALNPFFPNATLYIIYGSSEAEPIAIRVVDDHLPDPAMGYPVGTIHPAITVKIEPLGEIKSPTGDTHTVGEILVRGAHVAAPADTWLATGDFGYIQKDRSLMLTGRKGNEMIRSGVQHYQIEHVLSHVPGVDRVAARSTETGFTVFVEGTVHPDTLWQALQANFPDKPANRILFRDTLPVDERHQSKIRYERLV
ncbi:class I adenylate-forming enzyme family protein [Arsenicibacter rosenii]|uniref:AMP-dependent synthetase/ligase domain-containing protein n=1 Tax=Arsenicibacter rosenii TaxID=1750698 RepID=A0A1S2VD00_9BACT|nr:class I adenylate-forming enzyme family protein [Arsenicibacter rosenii]OIN56621.1 hypothetical protein BLX24_23610 [Arsenicibacter rosenii]